MTKIYEWVDRREAIRNRHGVESVLEGDAHRAFVTDCVRFDRDMIREIVDTLIDLRLGPKASEVVAQQSQPAEPQPEGDVPEWFTEAIRDEWFATDEEIAKQYRLFTSELLTKAAAEARDAPEWRKQFAIRVRKRIREGGCWSAEFVEQVAREESAIIESAITRRVAEATADKDRRIAELEGICGVGGSIGQAQAWLSVYEECERLGLTSVSTFSNGLDRVLKFIRNLHQQCSVETEKESKFVPESQSPDGRAELRAQLTNLRQQLATATAEVTRLRHVESNLTAHADSNAQAAVSRGNECERLTRELDASTEYHANFRSKIDEALGSPRYGGDMLSNIVTGITKLREEVTRLTEHKEPTK